MRQKAIDTFRGFAIVGMVFFSLTAMLSRTLPNIIQHNVPHALHLGDFVLPMFLFASGMSLVFYRNKRQSISRSEFSLDIFKRLLKLLIVGALLTPFSAMKFMQMDEVLLSTCLFLPSVLLVDAPAGVIIGLCLFLLFLYPLLGALGLLPAFQLHYLGGYAAAPFYLPVMLAGVLAGKIVFEQKELKPLLLGSSLVFLLLTLFEPPHKMSASPSFMALSVVFSLLVFLAIRNRNFKHLNYLGRRPLRYWVLMFIFAIIPAELFTIGQGYPYPLGFSWKPAVILALLFLVVLYLVVRLVDRAYEAVERLEARRSAVS